MLEAACKGGSTERAPETSAADQRIESTCTPEKNHLGPGVQPTPHKDAAESDTIKEEAMERHPDAGGNAPPTPQPNACAFQDKGQDDRSQHSGAPDGTVVRIQGTHCGSDIPEPLNRTGSRRERVARMREVEELLAHVGEDGDRGCRSTPLMIGPKPAAGLLDTECLKSIREQLDAASAAAKEQFKAGVRILHCCHIAFACIQPLESFVSKYKKAYLQDVLSSTLYIQTCMHRLSKAIPLFLNAVLRSPLCVVVP